MTLIQAMSPNVILKEARHCWSLLNGVICVYKDPGKPLKHTINVLKLKLCEDLNALQRLPRQEIVQIQRVAVSQIEQDHTTSSRVQEGAELLAEVPDGKQKIQIVKKQSFADHPLVVGAGYQKNDIKIRPAYHLGKESSGVAVLGINKGMQTSNLIRLNRWVKTYQVCGQLGKATDTFFHTGKVLEKARFEGIQKAFIDRVLAKSQTAYQRLAFDAAGVPLNSARAYELASEGVVRPATESTPIIYAAKCTELKVPYFELEISAVNENENYLCNFIHELGLKLHSVAVCTKIRCIKVGPFTVESALLLKHCTADHVIENMSQTDTILKQFNLYERDPLITDY